MIFLGKYYGQIVQFLLHNNMEGTGIVLTDWNNKLDILTETEFFLVI